MIVALTGKKRSGKDTVARILTRDYGFYQYALADPMKAAVQAIFGWNDRHTDGAIKERVDPQWGISPRQALQDIGTEWGQYGLSARFPEFAKTTYRLLWTRRFCEDVYSARFRWVVSDVRFPHELDHMRTVAHVVCVRVQRDTERAHDAHESESYDLDPDYTLQAETVHALETQARVLFGTVLDLAATQH